jgi:hypothetical protein
MSRKRRGSEASEESNPELTKKSLEQLAASFGVKRTSQRSDDGKVSKKTPLVIPRSVMNKEFSDSETSSVHEPVESKQDENDSLGKLWAAIEELKSDLKALQSKGNSSSAEILKQFDSLSKKIAGLGATRKQDRSEINWEIGSQNSEEETPLINPKNRTKPRGLEEVPNPQYFNQYAQPINTQPTINIQNSQDSSALIALLQKQLETLEKNLLEEISIANERALAERAESAKREIDLEIKKATQAQKEAEIEKNKVEQLQKQLEKEKKRARQSQKEAEEEKEKQETANKAVENATKNQKTAEDDLRNLEEKVKKEQAERKQKEQAEKQKESWSKRLSISELRDKYEYLNYEEDQNERSNEVYISQLKGFGTEKPIELQESGFAIVDYVGKEDAVRTFNEHLDRARGFARYRNPTMTIALVENADGSKDHHLIFSSPKHGISTKIVSERVVKEILKESDAEFRKSLEATVRLKALKALQKRLPDINDDESEYGDDLKSEYGDEGREENFSLQNKDFRYLSRILRDAENSLNSSSTNAWANWKRSEQAFAIFESEIVKDPTDEKSLLENFKKAGLLDEYITEEDVIDSFKKLWQRAQANKELLNYDNSTLSESGHKECLEILSDLYPNRSEAIEKLNNYDFSNYLDVLDNEDVKNYSRIDVDSEVKKITPKERDQLRKRAVYKEVDEDIKCVDLGYSEREKNIIKNSNIHYRDFDIRGNKKERFDHFLDNIDGWTGRHDGLSHRRSEGDENIATVVFKGLKNGDGPYDGKNILYVEMRGTEPGTKYYVKVELASANKDYSVYDSGKLKMEKHKTGDLIFDQKTVYYIDKDGNHQPKPTSELSDFNKKRYEALSISAISMIGGERKTAVLFEGRTTPCVSLAKSEKAIDEKVTDNENKFDSVLSLSDKFDIVVKMKHGKDGKWYPEGHSPYTMYLRNIHDKDANLKEVPIGSKSGFFKPDTSKITSGYDKELLDFLEKNGVEKKALEDLMSDCGLEEAKDKTKSRKLCEHFEEKLKEEVTPKSIFSPKGREVRKVGALQSKDDIGLRV